MLTYGMKDFPESPRTQENSENHGTIDSDGKEPSCCYITGSDFSTTEDEAANLEPKLQNLVKDYQNLSAFERLCGFKAPIVWPNVVKMLVLHGMAFTALYYGPKATWGSWMFFTFLYVCSNFGVTAGAHRYWTHRSYKATLPLQVALMCLFSISMQNDILEWCRDHRVHHKYSETSADPHNAKRGFLFAHIGWLLMKKHPDIIIKGRNVNISDLKRDPVVMFHHQHYPLLSLIFSVVLPVAVPWYFWGEDLWIAFVVLFAFRYVTTLHATWLVNSAAHLWGSRNYDKHINPADNRLVSFAALGEGWHNYHHTFPYDYAAGEWGSSINLTTIVLDLLAALGLVYDRKQVSSEAIERVRKRIGDLSSS